jgi:hypothetical protein
MKMRLAPSVAAQGAWLIAGRSAAGGRNVAFASGRAPKGPVFALPGSRSATKIPYRGMVCWA